MKLRYSLALLFIGVCCSYIASAQEQPKTTSVKGSIQVEQSPEQKAQNNNTVRSNRTESRAPTGQTEPQPDNSAAKSKKGYDYYKAQSDMNATKSQNHNPTRSNRTTSKADESNGPEKNNTTEGKTETSESARAKRK